MTGNGREIYKRPTGDPVDVAVMQYDIMENAFLQHQKEQQVLKIILDGLNDEQYEEYMKRTQP